MKDDSPLDEYSGSLAPWETPEARRAQKRHSEGQKYAIEAAKKKKRRGPKPAPKYTPKGMRYW